MDHHHPAVKEEHVQIGVGSGGDGSSSSSCSSLYFGNVGVPQAMEGLHDAGPPPFVTKTFDMVDDPTTVRAVSWSRGGQSFVVWDPHAFSTTLLPKYFKHSNFSSFVRQLNTYGFRKIDPDRWEFANEGFLMGHKHLLKYIRRRKVAGQSMPMASQQAVVPCVVELGEYGGGTTDADAAEVDRLRRDKEILMLEMSKLRQHQQNIRTYLQTMEQRIQHTEQKQHRMMAFIARAVQNPAVIHQLLQHNDKRKGLDEGPSNGKRRLSMNQVCTSSQGQGSNLSLNRTESDRYEVSELEALALEIQGYRKAGKVHLQDEEIKFRESMEKELDEEFWEELLLTGWLDIRGEVRKDEDLSLLADKLGYLGSVPK